MNIVLRDNEKRKKERKKRKKYAAPMRGQTYIRKVYIDVVKFMS